MNRIYRLVWSQISNSWIAVAENAKGYGKSISGRKLVAAALSLMGMAGIVPALAGPTGGQVTAGSGSIVQPPTSTITTINQISQNLSLSWQSFNIAPQETVNFVQPSASSIAVNRIFDTNGTQILGHLNANGQVYLINPNGILFGQGAQVNVGGLVASTLDVKDASLSSNSQSFSGTGAGSVVNQGAINAVSGGYVAFLGNHVSNQGTISAQLGTVALGAGSAVTLTFNGNNLLGLQVDQSVLNSLAENGGLIQADGGHVVMTAGAAQSLLASTVNNTGIVEAQTVDSHAGTITLLGGMAAGTLNVGGTLDASAPNNGNGGTIETSAANVQVIAGAKITSSAPYGLTGSWLIDPVDFTIAVTGGDITGAALGTLLGSNSVLIDTSAAGSNTSSHLYGASGTSGNIYVNDGVSWSSNNTLTLSAQNNIYINSPINVTGTSGGLALLYGQQSAGGGSSNYYVNAPVNLASNSNTFQTQLGSSGSPVSYTIITALGNPTDQTTPGHNTLAGMGYGISIGSSTNFVLGGNINASATSTWNAGQGFFPLGSNGSPFNAIFDGLGHTITGLTINSTAPYQGLFGYINSSAVVQNVALAGVNIGAGGIFTANYVGGLVGYNNGGLITNSFVGGSVIGAGYTGGLVGYNTGTVSKSYSTASVGGSSYVGGVVGYNTGAVSNSYTTGSVTGSNYTGGLVGENNGGAISNAYATGIVSGSNYTGGLVGYNNAGTISDAYAMTGSVNGSACVGGLVGWNNSTITQAYATGSVTGTADTGGLVGKNLFEIFYLLISPQ